MFPVIISSFVLAASVRLVKDETRRANKAILTQLRDIIDGQLEDVKKSALEAAINPGISAFVEVENPSEQIRSWDYFLKADDLIGDLNYYSLSNSIVKDCFIYFGASETVFTARGFEPVEDFYRSYYGYPETGVGQWLTQLFSSPISRFSELVLYDRTGKEVTSLIYVVPLPGPEKGQEVLIVFVIDQEWIARTVRSLNTFRLEEVYILDTENRIWFSSAGDEPDLEKIDLLAAARNGSTQFRTSSGVRMAAIRTESSLTDWIYLSVGPYRYLSGNSDWIKLLSLISIIASVVLGVLLAIYFARRNYSPVKSLIDLVSRDRAAFPFGNENEFEYIRGAVEEKDRRRKRLEKLVARQEKTLRQHYLARHLKGRVVPQEAENKLSGLGRKVETDTFFAVLLFHLHISDEDEAEEGEALLPDIDNYFHTVQSCLKAKISKPAAFELIEVDGMPAAVLSFPKDSGLAVERYPTMIARTIVDCVEQHLPVIVTVALSSIHTESSRLPSAYTEALNAMEYRYLNSTGNVISSDDIESPTVERPAFAEDDKRKLINLIRAGNGDEAEELFLEIVAGDKQGRDFSLYTRKFFLFELAFTVIRSIQMPGNENREDSFEEEYFKSILKSETLDETVETIRRKIRSICRITRRRVEEGREHRIGERINSLIASRYADKNLSLTMLSDELSLNPQYLATLYKQETGDTILNRINLRRIAEVKKFLQESSDSLGVIAEKCGFGNTHSLIRVFKKYEGVTPGTYKEMLQDEG
jgi:AraC-like DNA-binding protein